MAFLFEEGNAPADFLKDVRDGNMEIAEKIQEIGILLATAGEDGLDDIGLPL